MNYIILSFLFFINFNNVIFGQWVEQMSGTSNRLMTCYFLNSELGWAAGDDGTILKTTNGGITWIAHNLGTLDNIHAIHFIDSLKGWAVLYEHSPGRHGSIIQTTDGGISWNVQLTESGNTLHSIHFIDENIGWVAGSSGVIYHTENGGDTWVQQFPPENGWLWPIYFIDDNIGWTTGDPVFGIFRSTDGGFSWSSETLPVVERVLALVFVDSLQGWLCGTQGQIAGSGNGGITWETVSTGTSQELRDIFALDYSSLWCVGYNGTILNSSNMGSTWNQKSSGTNANLFSIHFVDENTGWVVGDNGIILKTENAGVPVELVSFSATRINDIINLSWITATELNNSGFEIERKLNDSWESIGFVEGTGTATETIHYSYSDDISSVKDINRIYYRLKQIDFDGSFEFSDVIEVEVENPDRYSLSQNYPNPFNPSTTIKFSVAVNGLVRLGIYDLLGNKVKTLVNYELAAGKYNVEFNASKLSSGIYLYLISAGDYLESKKMILLK